MEPWLTDLLATLAAAHPDWWGDMNWTTKRRIAIKARWPADAQAEAMQDQLAGRTDGGNRWPVMQAEIAAIKAAIPKE